MSVGREILDFDEEGRALWARLNLDGAAGRSRGQWNALDSLYRHPATGGTLFVGNQSAAQSLSLLRASGITHVVNCTHGPSKIPNYHPGELQYFEFPIRCDRHPLSAVLTHPQQLAQHRDGPRPLPHVRWASPRPPSSLTLPLAFVDPLFAFIDSALSRGSSVLVHCLAGAHRAGTTGCLCLMHYAGESSADRPPLAHRPDMDVVTAIAAAKKLRPVIDPIGHLPEFLSRYQVAKRTRGASAKAT